MFLVFLNFFPIRISNLFSEIQHFNYTLQNCSAMKIFLIFLTDLSNDLKDNRTIFNLPAFTK